MKDVMKRIAQSPIAEYNKFKVLSHIKSVAVAELNGDRVLVYANGDTLEFHNSSENNLMFVYQDFINQLSFLLKFKGYIMKQKLKTAMMMLSSLKSNTQHKVKLGEECCELSVDIFKSLTSEKKGDDSIIKEIADVLNCIDIFLLSVGLDKDDLTEYRFKQVEKHLPKKESNDSK